MLLNNSHVFGKVGVAEKLATHCTCLTFDIYAYIDVPITYIVPVQPVQILAGDWRRVSERLGGDRAADQDPPGGRALPLRRAAGGGATFPPPSP